MVCENGTEFQGGLYSSWCRIPKWCQKEWRRGHLSPQSKSALKLKFHFTLFRNIINNHPPPSLCPCLVCLHRWKRRSHRLSPLLFGRCPETFQCKLIFHIVPNTAAVSEDEEEGRGLLIRRPIAKTTKETHRLINWRTASFLSLPLQPTGRTSREWSRSVNELPTRVTRSWSWRRSSTTTGTWLGGGASRSPTLWSCPSAR